MLNVDIILALATNNIHDQQHYHYLGCEYHGYSSDISRTWPANGWFSDAQKTLYEATLSVQKELIDMCHARPSLDTLYEAMCFKLGKALAEAHVFKKNVDSSELNMVNIKLSLFNFCRIKLLMTNFSLPVHCARIMLVII